MEDAEYSEYLKKQSYEELVSISHSIDQEAQPQRYEMVMAEITRRDKDGVGKDSPNDNKRCLKFPPIVLGALFAFAGLAAIWTGRAITKHRHGIARARDPVEFWFVVGIDFALAITYVFAGFSKGRK